MIGGWYRVVGEVVAGKDIEDDRWGLQGLWKAGVVCQNPRLSSESPRTADDTVRRRLCGGKIKGMEDVPTAETQSLYWTS